MVLQFCRREWNVCLTAHNRSLLPRPFFWRENKAFPLKIAAAKQAQCSRAALSVILGVQVEKISPRFLDLHLPLPSKQFLVNGTALPNSHMQSTYSFIQCIQTCKAYYPEISFQF